MSGDVDPRSGKLVTLPQASKLRNRPANYFTVRRQRWRGHSEHPFPEPVLEVGGSDVFDLKTLILWDERRIKREADRLAGANKKEQSK